MTHAERAKKCWLTRFRDEVIYEVTHETGTDCPDSARARMKLLAKGNEVQRERAAWLKGLFSVHDMLERQLKRA